jgi:hypothetical protein
MAATRLRGLVPAGTVGFVKEEASAEALLALSLW